MGNQDCGYRKQRKGEKVGKNTHDNRMEAGEQYKGGVGRRKGRMGGGRDDDGRWGRVGALGEEVDEVVM
jgi:hypothetical protein